MTPRRTLIAAVVSSGLLLAACGEDTSVGNEETFQFDQNAANELGGSTTTVTAAPETIPGQTTTTAAAAAQTTTTVAQTTTTLPPDQQEVSQEILIKDDSAGKQFDPVLVYIPVGGKVRFKNAGTASYSVVSDGLFASGPIAPGAVWIFQPTAPGTVDYYDGTRPYAVGQIIVQ